MKILAVTDEVVDSLHDPSIATRFADVDMLVSCGDLPYGYLEYLVTVLNKPTYYAHGNHDVDEMFTDDGPVRVSPAGADSLDLRTAVGPKGVLLAGLEGSIRYDPRSSHQYTQGEMTRRACRLVPGLVWNRVRHGRFLDILVTHSPAFGVGDGPDYPHVGFRAFRHLIHHFRPKLLLHGHRHIYGEIRPDTMVESTRVINFFPFRVIEVAGDDIRCLVM